MARAPLRVKAATEWKRRYVEELSLEENDELEVLKTSMSGWWYCEDAKGRDGLVPFMYVEVISGTYADFTDLSFADYAHIEKTVFDWDIHQIIQVIFQRMKLTADEQNTLLHALRRLFSLCHKEEDRFTFLSQGGLDRLVEILANTHDIAQSMFCLRNIILLAPTQVAKRYPAQSNITEAIVEAMEKNMGLASYIATACDAIANACFENEKQRRLAAQTKAVPLLLGAMKSFRDKFGIQYSSTRALGNLLAEPKAQAAFDDESVRIMLEALNAQFSVSDSGQMKGVGMTQQHENQGQFAQQVITVLGFLVGDPKKASVFAASGGFLTLKNMYLSVGIWEENTRQCLISVINSMSQNPQTAKLFIENVYEGYDMLCELVSNADTQSQFFFQIYSILTYLTSQLHSPAAETAITRALERYEVGSVSNKALRQEDNVKLQEAVVSFIAIGARTKDKECLEQIIRSKLPFKFIAICLQKPPSKVFLSHTLLTLYNLTFTKEYCDMLMDNGVMSLCNGKWIRDVEMDSVTIQNGAATLYNILKNLEYRLPSDVEEQCNATCRYLKSNRPSTKDVAEALEKALRRQEKLGEQTNKQKKEVEKKKQQRKEQEFADKEKQRTEKVQTKKEKKQERKQKPREVEEEDDGDDDYLRKQEKKLQEANDDEYDDHPQKSKDCIVM